MRASMLTKYLQVNPLMRLINDLIRTTAHAKYVMLSILAP